jgi:hypothetical protein
MAAGMAIESPPFNSLLAAAAGDDAALADELRVSVIASAQGHVDLLRRSRCDANWMMSARRLKGLAETFGLAELVALAQTALDGAPGDPRVLIDLTHHLDRL